MSQKHNKQTWESLVKESSVSSPSHSTHPPSRNPRSRNRRKNTFTKKAPQQKQEDESNSQLLLWTAIDVFENSSSSNPSKFIALGTKSGMILICDHTFKILARFLDHTKSILRLRSV